MFNTLVSVIKVELIEKQEREEKNSWYSRGGHTTGANDTFACCRSGAVCTTSGI